MRDLSTGVVPLRRARQGPFSRTHRLWISPATRVDELLKEGSLERKVLTFRPGDCAAPLAPSANPDIYECVPKIAAPTDGLYNAPGQVGPITECGWKHDGRNTQLKSTTERNQMGRIRCP